MNAPANGNQQQLQKSKISQQRFIHRLSSLSKLAAEPAFELYVPLSHAQAAPNRPF
jgi:hypothetical protein